jgi:2'-5' RNA ligase
VREDATSAERARVAEAVAALNAPRFTLFHVEHVSLMRSHLGPGGARYEALQVWKLEEPGTA